MRFLRLRLAAFGSFSDRELEFARPDPGLHVIYGPNEAGKSTTLRALTSLLYGIERAPADAHKHSAEKLRIEAELEFADGSRLALVRRRGKHGLSDGAGASFEHPLPAEHSAFAYVFDGTLIVGAGDTAETVRRGELAALGPGKRVVFSAGKEPGRAILVAGRPLREPVAKYGPFVMNTDQEIVQAIQDYQAGRF